MIRALFPLFALCLCSCSGDWTVPVCDLAPKQALDTQSDCAGASRVPWSGPEAIADLPAFALTDAGADAADDAGEGGAP